MKPQLTIEAFAAWCEKQPTANTYWPGGAHDCAYCQYLKANGYPKARVDNTFWQPDFARNPDHSEPLDARINSAVYGSREKEDWTFGALTARLRQAAQVPA